MLFLVEQIFPLKRKKYLNVLSQESAFHTGYNATHIFTKATQSETLYLRNRSRYRCSAKGL